MYYIYLKFDSRNRFFKNQSFSNNFLILIRLGCIFWPLQLNFKSFHSNLKAIHSLNGGLRTGGVVEADKAEAFALIRGSVNEDLGADNVAKGKEHLHQFSISKLLWKMVDKQVTSFRTTDRTPWNITIIILLFRLQFKVINHFTLNLHTSIKTEQVKLYGRCLSLTTLKSECLYCSVFKGHIYT